MAKQWLNAYDSGRNIGLLVGGHAIWNLHPGQLRLHSHVAVNREAFTFIERARSNRAHARAELSGQCRLPVNTVAHRAA